MELRCRVCKFKPWDGKHGNKARNVNKPGALHTPSLRLDFFALLFVSRQKVEEEKRNISQLLLGKDIRQINLLKVSYVILSSKNSFNQPFQMPQSRTSGAAVSSQNLRLFRSLNS